MVGKTTLLRQKPQQIHYHYRFETKLAKAHQYVQRKKQRKLAKAHQYVQRKKQRKKTVLQGKFDLTMNFDLTINFVFF